MSGHVCPWWLGYTFDNPFRSLFHKPEIIFADYVHEGQVVADIGCGMGYFSIGLAKRLKNRGKVYSIDIQEKMLRILKKRAQKAGVSDVIFPQLSKPNSISFQEQIDFALIFWMLHETSDRKAFLSEIFNGLKPSGLMLLTEPKMHVSQKQMHDETEMAEDIGFKIFDRPKIAFSHAAVLKKR